MSKIIICANCKIIIKTKNYKIINNGIYIEEKKLKCKICNTDKLFLINRK
jgi:hypothetical protein